MALADTSLYILLSLLRGPNHGYAVMRDVEHLSDGTFRIAAGNTYTSLQRLVAAGLVEPMNSDGTRNGTRKVYRLSSRGRDAVELQHARIQRLDQAFARATQGISGEVGFEAAEVEPARTEGQVTAPRPNDDTPAVRPTGVQVGLLGPLDVRIGGEQVSNRAWRTSKAKELFSLLLVHRDRAMGRDEVTRLLWPEAESASGISNFHFTLHALRKALASTGVPSAPIVRTEGGYQLVAVDRVAVDVDVFDLLLNEAERTRSTGRPDDAIRLFKAATALYRADLLSDLDAEWIAERREAILRRYLTALRTLAEMSLEREDTAEAIMVCRTYLAREPYDEHVHRILMRAYHAAGDGVLVERHFRALEELLRHELGRRPEKKTVQLFERLQAKDARPTALSPLRFTAH